MIVVTQDAEGSTVAATAPIAGKMNRYGRSIQRCRIGRCSASGKRRQARGNANTPTARTGSADAPPREPRPRISSPASRRREARSQGTGRCRKQRKRREPADLTAGIFAIRELHPSTRAPTVSPCIKVAIRDPPAKLKSQIQRSVASCNETRTPHRAGSGPAA